MVAAMLMKELRRAVHAQRRLHGSVVGDARAMFAAMDADGSGTVSPAEMKDALMRLDLTQYPLRYGWGVSGSELDDLIGELDTNGNGLIEWGEFLRASGLEDRGHTAAEAAVRAEQARLRAALEAAGAGRERPSLAPTSRKARHALFNRMDANGNGVLSLAEIDKAVVECYPAFDHKPSLMAAYKAADTNRDGWIGRREFGRFLRSLVYYNNLWHKFDVMDEDGDRRLELHEFVAGCRHIGVDISDEQAEDEFWQIAEAHGHVLFGEFCEWAGRWHLSVDDEDEDDIDESSPQAKSSVQSPSVGGPYYHGVVHETDPFPLHTAAKDGNENSVNQLVSSGTAKVDATNEGGATPLLNATGAGHLACVRALLDLGADVDKADDTGCTALQVAALVGHEGIAALLLDKGADINKADNRGNTALTIAQTGEHLPVLSLLESAAVGRYLQAGGSSQAAQAEVQLAAEMSAEELEKMEKELAQSQVERASDAMHSRPLEHVSGPFVQEGLQSVEYMAARLQAEKTGLAKEMIQIQAAKSRQPTSTPYAMLGEKDGGPSDAALLAQLAELDAELARRADSDVQNVAEVVDVAAEHARLLVQEVKEAQHLVAKRTDADEAEAELTERDQMHTAAATGREEDLMDLINRGAQVDIRDQYLRTPLQIAAMYGHTHCVERLLENKADPNNTDFLSNADREGCTALAHAAMNGRDETVQKLLEHHADTELPDSFGCTPLHLASQHGRDTVVKILLDNGANINACDCRGWTALHRAAATGEVKVVEHLVGHSVNQKATDDEGKTAYHRAKEEGHENVLILLDQVDHDRTIGNSIRPVGTELGVRQHALQTHEETPGSKPETTAPAISVVPANTPESRNDVAHELIRMREQQLKWMAAERQAIREEKAELNRLKENVREDTAQMVAEQKVAEKAKADAQRAASVAAEHAALAIHQADRAATAPLENTPHSFGTSDAVARARQDAAALAVEYAAQQQAAVDRTEAQNRAKGSGVMEMWGDYSQEGLFGILAAPEASDSDLNAQPTQPVPEVGRPAASSAAVASQSGDGEDWAEGPYGYRWELSDAGRALLMGGLEGFSSSAPPDNRQVLPEHLRPPTRVAAAGGGSPKNHSKSQIRALERSLAFSAEELSRYEDPTAKALEAAGVPQQRAKDAAAAATVAVAATEQLDKAWEDLETAATVERERAAHADQSQERPVPPPRPSTSHSVELQTTRQSRPNDEPATAKLAKHKKKPNKFLAGPAADFVPYDPREKFGPLTEPTMSVEALERVRRGNAKAPRPFSFEEREAERIRTRPAKLSVAAAMVAESAAKQEKHLMKANMFRAKEVPDYLSKTAGQPPLEIAGPFKLTQNEQYRKNKKLACRHQARLEVKKRAEESFNKPMPANIVEWSHKREGELGLDFGDQYPCVEKIHRDSPADNAPGLRGVTTGLKLLSIETKDFFEDSKGTEIVKTTCVKTEGLSYVDAKHLLLKRPLKLRFQKGGWRAMPLPKDWEESFNKPMPANVVEWSHKREGNLGLIFGDQYPYVKKIHRDSPADNAPGLTTGCKLLSIETKEFCVDPPATVVTMRVKTDGLSYADAKEWLRKRPLKLRFQKGGLRAMPVPKACDYESVGKLDKMARADQERKLKNRAKAEAKFREAQAPQLSPTKAKRNAKLRASLDKRQAALAQEVATAAGQNKENPFEQRWSSWLRSEGLHFHENAQTANVLLSMRQLQRACRKVAGLPPLSGAEMGKALSEMKIGEFDSNSNPDAPCITTKQAKKWVRDQQRNMCWGRVQSSATGLPLASATKVLADIIADEQRFPETRWPNVGPRYKIPRAQFIEDRPKIVFETTDETHYREVLQMTDAEHMELEKAKAAMTVKLMQERQQEATTAATQNQQHQETADIVANGSPQPQGHDVRDTEMDELEAPASRGGSEHQHDEDGDPQEPPFYVKAAEIVTKQQRTVQWVDEDAGLASEHADPRAVDWAYIAEAERMSGEQDTASTAVPSPPPQAHVQASAPAAVGRPKATATRSPGEAYMARKRAQDVQKEELLALESQRTRKLAARAQRKNELMRLAAENQR